MSFISRNLEAKLKAAAEQFPVLVLAGPRQTGKTTLLAHLFSSYRYVTLDRHLAAEQAEKDPEAFLAQFPAPLLIDEVQYAPSLFRFLKLKVDQNRDQKGQYILTGSQKFTLMQGVSESLAGRAAIFEFEGLSCIELLQAGLTTTSLEDIIQLIIRGGFPELWQDKNRDAELYLESYIATSLERDVKQVLSVGNLRDYERFLRACALRSGQILNKSDLARDIGISVTTVGEWLSVLQALGHIVLLEPWFGNLNKRLVKSPKLYLSDTGLLCRLCGVRASTLLDSPLIGAIWETFIFSELRKQYLFRGAKPSLWFYRDQGQNEIDFLIEDGPAIELIECKWTSQPTNALAKSLNKISEIFSTANSKHWSSVRKKVVSRGDLTWQSGDVFYCSPFSGLV